MANEAFKRLTFDDLMQFVKELESEPNILAPPELIKIAYDKVKAGSRPGVWITMEDIILAAYYKEEIS